MIMYHVNLISLMFLPRKGDDSLTVASAENHLVDELDDEDRNVFSDASLYFSNILEPDPEKRSENMLDDVPPTGYSEDGCSKNLSGSIDFIVDEDAILSAGEIAMNKTPAVCGPQTHNYTEHLSETTYDVNCAEACTSYSGACTSYSGEKHLDSHNAPDPKEIELPVGGTVTEFN